MGILIERLADPHVIIICFLAFSLISGGLTVCVLSRAYERIADNECNEINELLAADVAEQGFDQAYSGWTKAFGEEEAEILLKQYGLTEGGKVYGS